MREVCGGGSSGCGPVWADSGSRAVSPQAARPRAIASAARSFDRLMFRSCSERHSPVVGALAPLVCDLVPGLAAVARAFAALGMLVEHRDLRAPAEVGGDGGGTQVQPDVVAVERDQAEHG